MIDKNKNQTYVLNGKPIPIYRLDTSKNHKFMVTNNLVFAEHPQIYVYFQERFHHYQNSLNKAELFLHWLNRIVDPVVHLETKDQLAEFFDSIHLH